jgi:hypothetical protein
MAIAAMISSAIQYALLIRRMSFPELAAAVCCCGAPRVCDIPDLPLDGPIACLGVNQ